jgi:hypothetical protein
MNDHFELLEFSDFAYLIYPPKLGESTKKGDTPREQPKPI